MIKTCPLCGDDFKATHGKQLYCKNCRYKRRLSFFKKEVKNEDGKNKQKDLCSGDQKD